MCLRDQRACMAFEREWPLNLGYGFEAILDLIFLVEKFLDVEDLLRNILGLIWLHEIRSKNSLSCRNYKIITVKNLHSSTCA